MACPHLVELERGRALEDEINEALMHPQPTV
jgi:hypothetical protein